MPKYPWRMYSPLRTHEFDDGVSLKGQEPGQLFVCRNCGRRFKYDAVAHTTWAVGKGQGYSALQSSVTSRWISEYCAGNPSLADEEDSKRFRSRVA